MLTHYRKFTVFESKLAMATKDIAVVRPSGLKKNATLPFHTGTLTGCNVYPFWQCERPSSPSEAPAWVRDDLTGYCC
jgi:hypothetical protein